MAHRYYDLPSLTALTAFEASARHRSFKMASVELNVTPGAISRQIRSLEEELGRPLFVRAAAGIELTADAEELYAVLSNGFTRAGQVVRRIKSVKNAKHVTVACTNAFAAMWLMPRMTDFWRRFPDISIDHLITDSAKDFRRADIDLRVRYGRGSWPDEQAELLLDETIYPVCGPGFARQHVGACAGDIPNLSLLHLDWLDPDWTDWHELLRQADIPHGTLPGRRLSNFAVVMQACQDDQGLAVGWDRLVREAIRSGRLVAFSDLTIPAPGSYYLTWNVHREQTESVGVVREWLIAAATMDAR